MEDLKFTSLRGTRVVMLIMAPLLTAVYVAGPLGMLFWSLFFDRHSLFLSLFACCILPFGIWIGRFMLRDALDSFSVYRLSSEGIEIRRLKAALMMYWNEITDYEVIAHPYYAVRLTDVRGRRWDVRTQLMNDPEKTLKPIILERLAALREQKIARIAQNDRPIYPYRRSALPSVLAGGVVLCLTTLPFHYFAIPPEMIGVKILSFGVGVCTALWFFYGAASNATYGVQIGRGEIVTRYLSGQKRLVLSEVETAVKHEYKSTRGSGFRVTLLHRGQPFSYYSGQADREETEEYICRAVPAAAFVRGEALKPALERRSNLSVGSFLAGMFLFGAIVMAVISLPRTNRGLAVQAQLDRHGVSTMGRVDSVPIRCGCGNANTLDIAYTVRGTEYVTQAKYVSDAAYQSTTNQPVPVVYLPENPDVARSAFSTEKEHWKEERNYAFGMVLFCGLPSLLTLFYAYWQAQRPLKA